MKRFQAFLVSLISHELSQKFVCFYPKHAHCAQSFTVVCGSRTTTIENEMKTMTRKMKSFQPK